MIVGLGTDLVGVERIRRVLARHPERFLSFAFTSAERDYCLAARDPAERLAARWAAKEAAAKALGTGFAHGVRLTDIALLSGPGGAPRLELAGAAAAQAGRLGASRWLCTVSHAEGLAVAVVVLEA